MIVTSCIKSTKKMRTVAVFLMLLLQESLSANILGINPTPSVSHQKPFLIIMAALAEEGHHVTVITTDPLKNPPENFTQIDVSFAYSRNGSKEILLEITHLRSDKIMELLLPLSEKSCRDHFELPEIQQLLRTARKFDLVVMETYIQWCYFGFIHKLGFPPVVGFFSMGINSILSDVMGNPYNPSYMADVHTPYTDHMGFWERMDNAFTVLKAKRMFHNVVLPTHDRIIKEYFGENCPNVDLMVRNISLLITANHFSINYPQPLLPNVIEITGLHVEKRRTPLPDEIQQFVDGAQHGFIYFSLGSNMKSSYLPGKTRNALLQAFAELPLRVLWKYESDDLQDKPGNVLVAKWLPQQDILAHQKIRLFITQGGLQSLNEAAYFGVPLLGIPFIGDQRYNVAKIVRSGIGEKMEFSNITKESFLRAVWKVLEDPRYQENMKSFSSIYREHQQTSTERAVWWVDYVLRHGGAAHLRSAGLDLRWWQLLLLDVAAFAVAVGAATAFLLNKTLHYFVNTFRRSCKQKPS